MRKHTFFFVSLFLFFPLFAEAASAPELAVASALFKPNGDIQVTAKNVGALATTIPVTVGAYWFDGNGDYLYTTDFKTVGPLDVFVYSLITIKAADVPKDAARVIFYADPASKIAEVNEWNNEFEFVFPVAKFEAVSSATINGVPQVTITNVGQREYKPEACTFCFNKKFARVVWRSADALQKMSSVLETSLIPAPIGPDVSATVSFTKKIPTNATFLVADVYQYNAEDWMGEICIMCDSIKPSPTRMFIPVQKRADIVISDVIFDEATTIPSVVIKNISDIPFEMSEMGEINWAYFYDNGDMQNSKIEKMEYAKKIFLPGESVTVALPESAKLSYGITKMLVVYDTSSFYSAMAGKIIEANVGLYNKEVDVKNNMWSENVPQPDIKIQSATLISPTQFQVVFKNLGKQKFELCSGFSICGKKIDVEYFGKDGKLSSKLQTALASGIGVGKSVVQDFETDSNELTKGLSAIRITHDFGVDSPSVKNGRVAYIYLTDEMLVQDIEPKVIKPGIFASLANSVKMFFAFSPARKAEVAAERVEILSRTAAAAEQERDIESYVKTRSELRRSVSELSDLRRDEGVPARAIAPEVRRMIEVEDRVEVEVPKRETEVEIKREIEPRREIKIERENKIEREIKIEQRVEIEDEVEDEIDVIERPIVIEVPAWQKFRNEQVAAIDQAYAEVIARKNRLTSRENISISAEWSAAHNLFTRARRTMGEYAAVERQQELFTRVQIDAARQLKIMDEFVRSN